MHEKVSAAVDLRAHHAHAIASVRDSCVAGSKCKHRVSAPVLYRRRRSGANSSHRSESLCRSQVPVVCNSPRSCKTAVETTCLKFVASLRCPRTNSGHQVVFERSATAGSFFDTYPRHRYPLQRACAIVLTLTVQHARNAATSRGASWTRRCSAVPPRRPTTADG